MTQSSKRWLKEHFSDYYVKQAQQEGYPSRAAYKLLEMQEKELLIKPGMTVVDLGAAPGGWSMVARDLVGKKGKVIAVDCLAMTPIEGVHFIQGDFTDALLYEQLMKEIPENQGVDLVISDMSPNISGHKIIDQPRIMYLVELALDFAIQVLKPGGSFLTKIFQGQGVDALVKLARAHFEQVGFRKPKASRSRSSELYILASHFRGDSSLRSG
jgi:23S rRNA (uridine2552-2'-O)-methyltransferase